MSVNIEDIGPCRKLLRIEIPADVVAEQYGRVVSDYARNTSIPGFRKGKAPAKVIETRFGPAIAEELKSRLVSESYRESIRSSGLAAVTVVEVKNVLVEKGQPARFEATVDVAPSFDLPQYRGLKLEGRIVDITEQDVDKAIRSIRERAASYVEVSGRAAIAGDLVQVDFSGTCGAKPVRELVPDTPGIGEAKDFWVLAGEAGLIPGIAEALVGSEIGASLEVPVSFPSDFRVAALSGSDAVYRVAVKAMRERKLPELDSELLASLGADSESALRETLRKDMKAAAEREENARLKDQIVREMIEATEFSVPESLVQEETRKFVQEIVGQNVRRGVPREEIVRRQDDIVGAATTSSIDRIKASYILDAIAAKEGITEDEAEVERALAIMAGRYRVDREKLVEELEKRDAMPSLRRDIRADKTLDMIVACADIERKTAVSGD